MKRDRHLETSWKHDVSTIQSPRYEGTIRDETSGAGVGDGFPPCGQRGTQPCSIRCFFPFKSRAYESPERVESMLASIWVYVTRKGV